MAAPTSGSEGPASVRYTTLWGSTQSQQMMTNPRLPMKAQQATNHRRLSIQPRVRAAEHTC